ncbi:unnamed protein product [Leptidea sinapis]|uniref:Phosphotyrosine protein phosphatase I domain-containing protein n=1 Tax=Leptidea sinapis TaxID=189913 RepID=A0A5E4Q2W6_9NEOP|nr:unnamed protein product [Leptidea sinapis]
MDEENKKSLNSKAAEGSKAKLLLFGNFDPEGDRIIRDPYYDSDSAGFEQVFLEQIEKGNKGSKALFYNKVETGEVGSKSAIRCWFIFRAPHYAPLPSLKVAGSKGYSTTNKLTNNYIFPKNLLKVFGILKSYSWQLRRHWARPGNGALDAPLVRVWRRGGLALRSSRPTASDA